MSYLGSKWASGAYQTICALMPPHDLYVESHLGGGAVFLAKPPSLDSLLIEIDPDQASRFSEDHGVEVVCADALSTIDAIDYASSGRVFIYADPPYLHSTRTSRHRYRFEYTEDDHVKLLECLKRVPASVMLSGYPSKLYDDLLPGWRTHEFQVMTRGGVRTEKLWMNYEPVAAHWATFAGKDFTDRQRIKRKADRWAAKFRELPSGERLAILAALHLVA